MKFTVLAKGTYRRENDRHVLVWRFQHGGPVRMVGPRQGRAETSALTGDALIAYHTEDHDRIRSAMIDDYLDYLTSIRALPQPTQS